MTLRYRAIFLLVLVCSPSCTKNEGSPDSHNESARDSKQLEQFWQKDQTKITTKNTIQDGSVIEVEVVSNGKLASRPAYPNFSLRFIDYPEPRYEFPSRPDGLRRYQINGASKITFESKDYGTSLPNPEVKIDVINDKNYNLKWIWADAETVVSVKFIDPQDATRGEMTRALAEQILNTALSSPHMTSMQFTPDGMRQAQQQGLADNQTNGFFTPKAVKTIGRNLKNGRIYGVVGGGDFFFDLAVPVSERVAKVTGITDGPDQSTKIVEFETIYDLPKELELIREHIYTGQALKRNVKKYDDGWRVVE